MQKCTTRGVPEETAGKQRRAYDERSTGAGSSVRLELVERASSHSSLHVFRRYSVESRFYSDVRTYVQTSFDFFRLFCLTRLVACPDRLENHARHA